MLLISIISSTLGLPSSVVYPTVCILVMWGGVSVPIINSGEAMDIAPWGGGVLRVTSYYHFLFNVLVTSTHYSQSLHSLGPRGDYDYRFPLQKSRATVLYLCFHTRGGGGKISKGCGCGYPESVWWCECESCIVVKWNKNLLCSTFPQHLPLLQNLTIQSMVSATRSSWQMLSMSLPSFIRGRAREVCGGIIGSNMYWYHKVCRNIELYYII